MENVNRNHKNSVFSSLFSDPDVLRELYSAIEGIPIPYEKIIIIEVKYQKDLVKIPRPEFIVLYNGMEPYPDYAELKLSDAFMDIEGLKVAGIDKVPLELIVQVYNINHGHNPEMLKRSESLYGYSFFINKIREYQAKGLRLEELITPVIEYCIKNNILKEYLEAHASEVINMLTAEYDREMDIAVNCRKAREEGMEIAREKSRQYFLELINQGLSLDEIKERLQV